MTSKHRPDPEFVARLEWQLAGRLRSRQQFEQPETTARNWRWLKTAAVVLLSVSIGAAGAVTAGQIEDSWKAELWLARATTAVELAQARSQLFKEELLRMEGLAEHSVENWFQFRVEKIRADTETSLAQLDLEEVLFTGGPPQSELIAPFRGRDFVTERLEVNMAALRQRAALLDEYQQYRAEEGEALGEQRAIENELTQIDSQVRQIRSDIDLRRAFVNGEVSAAEIEIKRRLADAEQRVKEAEARLEMTTQFVEQVEQERMAGKDNDIEVRMARYEYTRIEAEARLARTELELLRRHLPERE